MPNIVELKRARAELVNKLNDLVTKDGDWEGNDDTTFEDLKTKVSEHDKAISDHGMRMKALEEMQAARDEDDADADADEKSADDEDDNAEEKAHSPAIRALDKHITKHGASRMLIKQPARKNCPPGTNFATYVMAAALEKKYGRGAGIHWLDTCHKSYDPSVKKVLASNSAPLGGFTVPQDFVAELIPLLRSAVLVRKINPRIYPMENGNLTIPRQSTSTTATWVGEQSQSSYSQITGDNINLVTKKLMATTAVTNDLIRRSALAMEAMVRDDLTEQLARAEDQAYLLNTTNASAPIGLLGQIAVANQFNAADTGTALNAAASSTWLAATAGVLSGMELTLKLGNINPNGLVWLVNPGVVSFLKNVTDQVGGFVYRDQLSNGKLWGYDIHESPIIPAALGSSGFGSPIFLIQPDELIIGDSLNVTVDSTDSGAYFDGSQLQSTFSTDRTAMRVIKESDLAMRHPTGGAVAFVEGWAPQGFTGYANSVAWSTQPLTNAVTSAQSAAPGVNPGP